MAAQLFSVDFGIDVDRFARSLDDISRKQLPYAARRALTDTARQTQLRLTKQLPSIFAKVTPFTARAIGFTGARDAERPTASVFVLDIQSRYLLHEEIGGARTPTENTRKPAHALLLPGPTLPLDAFGNIPGGAIARLRQRAEADKRVRQRRNAVIVFGSKRQASRARDKMTASRDAGVVFLQASEVPARFGAIGGYFLRVGGVGDRQHYLHRLTTFKSETHYRPKFGFRVRFEAFAHDVFMQQMSQRFFEALATAK